MEKSDFGMLKRILWGILILSFFGFLDALYLSIKKLMNSPINCFVFEGCQNVTNSSYANLFGLPLSFYGMIFYLAIFLLTVRFFEKKNPDILKTIFVLSIFGFLLALYLVLIQGFVIKYFCIYCLISAFTSTCLFGLSLFLRSKHFI